MPCLFFSTACAVNFETKEPEKICVVNIAKTDTGETSDTYLVTYSDNSTTSITIQHGQDGLNGQNLTMEELEKYCEEKGISLDEFIEQHVTVEVKINSVSSAAAHALKSTVNVYTSAGTGSGVIYKMEDEYSYIVTNYHVVYNASTQSISTNNKIFVYGYEYNFQPIPEDSVANSVNHGAIECSYIGGALNYDLAVLKAKTADILQYQPKACAVTLASDYVVGDSAIAIGNPSGMGTSVTAGCVSVESEVIEMTGADNLTTVNLRVMRIDTSVNPGNSGGGLFNINGELIGIVNAKLIDTTIDNINYALPHDNVTKVVDNLIDYYKAGNYPSSVKKLLINLQYVTDNAHAVFTETETGTQVKLQSEMLVKTVTENGLGDKMGVKIDDKIVGAYINRNGTTTEYKFDQSFEALEFTLIVRAGDIITFKIERAGEYINSNAQTITDADFTVIE